MKFGLVCVSLFALTTPALAHESAEAQQPPAAAAPAPSRLFDASDLFGLEVATDPQISPDGGRIAYVRRSGDIMTDRMRPTIWLIDTASGSQAPLVAGPGSHMSPVWSPDGTRLAYISTAEGGGAQLYVRWLASGESVRVTGLPQSPSRIAWSPDGRQLAYVMQVPSDAPRLGRTPPRPEGAQWAEPLQQIAVVGQKRRVGHALHHGPVAHVHNERIVARSAFGHKHFAHSGAVECVCAESVHGLGGCDKP